MLVQEIYSAFAFMFLIGLGCFASYLSQRINVQVLNEEIEIFHKSSFIATRAFKDLKVFNDFGPRPSGSDANEIYAVNFIFRRVNQIQRDYANTSEITIDHQTVSGVHLTSAYYRNAQNIVVKLQGLRNEAVMVNCHFDSEPGSSGAGDNAVNCCTMLEILRVIAKSDHRNKYSIVFLFNGREEGNREGLQASHGFITQHKWANDVKAYINLDSLGLGGRELLFRSGPRHDWLIKKYRQSVPNPFGQVFAEEMFDLNLLTSRTDFESFRDAGKIPGLDIAYCNQGWVYHTKYDHIMYMSIDTIQNTGNNMLELIKVFADSDELLEPPEGTAAVYFDLWGFFFVSYSAKAGLIANIIVSIGAVVVPFVIQVYKAKNKKSVAIITLVSFGTFIVGAILSLAACLTMGWIINFADRSMFWFNSTILSLGVYSALSVGVQIGVNHVACSITKCCSKSSVRKEDKFETRIIVQAELNGINLFWSLLTITASSVGFRLGYMTMIMLVISLITTALVWVLEFGLSKARVHSWIFVHFFGHLFTFLWASYLLLTFWQVYIPITANGFSSNPEIFMSLYCGTMTIFCLSYFIPLTSLLRSRAILYAVVLASFITCTILVFTTAGFPYNGSVKAPRVQRHYVTHTKRTLYDAAGEIRSSDVGYFIKEHERNTKRTLDSFLDSSALLRKDDDIMCKFEAFCAFPSYNTSNAFWTAANQEPSVEPSILRLTSKETKGFSTTMSFDIVCSLTIFVYIAPEPGVEIIKKSISFRKDEWTKGRVAYHLKLTNGRISNEPFSFEIITNSTMLLENQVKITIVTIDSHFEKLPKAEEFQDLIDKFPDYAWVQAHQADVSSYLF